MPVLIARIDASEVGMLNTAGQLTRCSKPLVNVMMYGQQSVASNRDLLDAKPHGELLHIGGGNNASLFRCFGSQDYDAGAPR